MIEELQYVNTENYPSGIYKITSIATGHYYYGSSKNLRARRGSHASALNCNSHQNKYMQNIYNKYRNRLWLYEVIEYVEPKRELLEVVEQNYIDKHIGRDLCMNLNPRAYGRPNTINMQLSGAPTNIEIKKKQEKNRLDNNIKARFKFMKYCFSRGIHLKQINELWDQIIFKSVMGIR